MNPTIQESIRVVVDYAWRDEQVDYDQMASIGEDVDGHIFEQLQTIDKWLRRSDES